MRVGPKLELEILFRARIWPKARRARIWTPQSKVEPHFKILIHQKKNLKNFKHFFDSRVELESQSSARFWLSLKIWGLTQDPSLSTSSLCSSKAALASSSSNKGKHPASGKSQSKSGMSVIDMISPKFPR